MEISELLKKREKLLKQIEQAKECLSNSRNKFTRNYAMDLCKSLMRQKARIELLLHELQG